MKTYQSQLSSLNSNLSGAERSDKGMALTNDAVDIKNITEVHFKERTDPSRLIGDQFIEVITKVERNLESSRVFGSKINDKRAILAEEISRLQRLADLQRHLFNISSRKVLPKILMNAPGTP